MKEDSAEMTVKESTMEKFRWLSGEEGVQSPSLSQSQSQGGRGLLLAALLAGVVTLGACQTQSSSSAGAEATEEDYIATVAPSKTGVELWADNCVRCHNVRDPSSYSDAQWDVAVHHMRIRANLTGQDAEAIREFILTAN
ncbi:MAG: hypothetical protein ACC661_05165 [Verrucomicrobiales bacterium]